MASVQDEIGKRPRTPLLLSQHYTVHKKMMLNIWRVDAETGINTIVFPSVFVSVCIQRVVYLYGEGNLSQNAISMHRLNPSFKFPMYTKAALGIRWHFDCEWKLAARLSALSPKCITYLCYACKKREISKQAFNRSHKLSSRVKTPSCHVHLLLLVKKKSKQWSTEQNEREWLGYIGTKKKSPYPVLVKGVIYVPWCTLLAS